MRNVLMLPIFALLIGIAVVALTQPETRAERAAEAVILDAELPASPSLGLARDGMSHLARSFALETIYHGAIGRTHVVQDRHESALASFDARFQFYTIMFCDESRHSAREAVGAAGVRLISHPSPITVKYPRDDSEARPHIRGGPV